MPTTAFFSSLRYLQTELVVVFLVALLAALTLTLRGFIPYDETRYIAVAWEMWREQHWLIPTINGNLYADKPPLLFWLVQLGWYLFGVNDWWPRSIPFIFALLNIFLTRFIACRIWPDRTGLREAVPMVLMCLPVWFVYVTPFMFDMLQTFFVLCAVAGLVLYCDKRMAGFIICGIAIGLGMLLKGPVILVYVLPLAVTIPLWNENYVPGNRFFLLKGLTVSLLTSLLVFALWLVPVSQTLGMEQVRAIFLHQTADRMAQASSHTRPFWWYLPFLPLLFFPWACKKSFWKSLRVVQNRTARKKWLFLLLWIIPTFVFLTSINAKQLHYLLPLVPPLVIGMAVLLTDRDTAASASDNYLAGCLFIFIGLAFYLYRTFTLHLQNQWIDPLSPLAPVIAIAAGMLVIWIKSRDQYHSIKIMALGTFVLLFSVYAVMLAAPRPFARIDEFSQRLAVLQKNNVPLGHVGSHREQFAFPGKLTKPLHRVNPAGIRAWAETHPDGYIITVLKGSDLQNTVHPAYVQPYRFRQNLALISCREILKGAYAF